jgi:hypothetical protein
VSHMNIKSVRTSWLIPVLGIVCVGSGYEAVRSYQGYDVAMGQELQFQATTERISEALRLLHIQARLEKASCPGASRQVDESLSFCVAELGRDLGTSDERTRGIITGFLEHMGRMQSQPPMASILPAKDSEAETGRAEELLAQARDRASVGP